MSWRVRVFRTESRTERINLFESGRGDLALELAGYGESRFLSEEVFLKVDAAVVFGDLRQIERGDVKHFAGAFAVGGCDDRSMNVIKPLLIEKLVYGKRCGATDA